LYSPENDHLLEKTNREGFLENTAFNEVKNTLLTIFRNLGRRRYNYRLLYGLGRGRPKSRHTRPDIREFLNQVNKTEDIGNIRKYSEKFMKDVTTSLDNLEESLSFSERLASLGTGIELVYHEMAQPISQFQAIEASLSLKEDKVPEEIKENFSVDIDALANSTEVLIELRKSLQPAIGRSRKKKFKPYETFLKVCGLFRSDFDEAKIKPKVDERIKDYEINNLEYAFWIAFLNIINNAVYWIKKSERPGEIRFHMEDGSFVVSNSGPLIREDIIDYIFEYGVTTRQEKHATGLGLSFTRSILSSISWEIVAENRANGPAFIIKEASND
jgi:signal transduction histidine kinase